MSPTWSRVAPVYAASGLSFIDKDSQRGAMCSWLDTDGARWATDGRRTSRWSPQGKLLWTVGRPTTASRPGPGETKTIHRFIGTAHGVGAVAEIHNSDSAVWDRNGLWIGRLLEQPDLSHADPQAYALCGENFGGVMIEEPGRPASALYYGGTPNAVAVFRITGFDRIQSSSGSVSPPQP
jgi:hypothetical protein